MFSNGPTGAKQQGGWHLYSRAPVSTLAVLSCFLCSKVTSSINVLGQTAWCQHGFFTYCPLRASGKCISDEGPENGLLWLSPFIPVAHGSIRFDDLSLGYVIILTVMEIGKHRFL